MILTLCALITIYIVLWFVGRCVFIEFVLHPRNRHWVIECIHKANILMMIVLALPIIMRKDAHTWLCVWGYLLSLCLNILFLFEALHIVAYKGLFFVCNGITIGCAFIYFYHGFYNGNPLYLYFHIIPTASNLFYFLFGERRRTTAFDKTDSHRLCAFVLLIFIWEIWNDHTAIYKLSTFDAFVGMLSTFCLNYLTLAFAYYVNKSNH